MKSLRHKISALALMLAFGIASAFAGPASAQVTTTTGVQLAVSSTGAPSKSRDRREEVRISQALATALGITTVNANGEDSPQIRVILTTDPISNQDTSALFTVTGIVSGTTKTIHLWQSEGRLKLFPSSSSSSDLSSARATVHDIAPSRTVEAEFGISGRKVRAETRHYTEASGAAPSAPVDSVIDPEDDDRDRFEEFVELNDAHHIAILAPHGGKIEKDISQHMWRTPLWTKLYTGSRPDVWEGYGWGDSQISTRWHITAPAIHTDSFPGLDQMAAHGPYRYGVALHGISGSTGAPRGIIIGGRSTRQEKCYMAVKIQGWMSQRNEVAIAIVYKEGSVFKALHVPDSSGRKVANVDDFKGTEASNIINRMAPNSTYAAGRGSFQFEFTTQLREEPYFEYALSGIGEGIGGLWTYHQAAEDDNACGDLVVPSGRSTSVETL